MQPELEEPSGAPGGSPSAQRPWRGPQQHPVFFCDVCSVNCVGVRTYREHVAGQKHRRKQQASQLGVQACKLCKVTCTGPRALAAHLKGARHKKILEIIEDAKNPWRRSASRCRKRSRASCERAGRAWVDSRRGRTFWEKMLGLEYVHEEVDADGRLVRLYCSLCRCSFNDLNGRDLHLCGRRHRNNYRAKVDPTLPLDAPSERTQRRLDDHFKQQRQERRRSLDTMRRWHHRAQIQDLQRARRGEQKPRDSHPEGASPLKASPGDPAPAAEAPEAEVDAPGTSASAVPAAPVAPVATDASDANADAPATSAPAATDDDAPATSVPPPPRTPRLRPQPGCRESREDRHVLSRHAAVYPADQELRAVQAAVEAAERALRRVSDQLVQDRSDGARLLTGVMRIGELAKGLLRPGAQRVRLLLLCSQKPTRGLLRSVAELLPQELPEVTKAEFLVMQAPEPPGTDITICYTEEPSVQVTVSLTSTLMRGDPATPQEAPREPCPDDEVLDPAGCLQGLRELRQAKWFQARASDLQPCVVVIRLLRDLRRRAPPWAPLPAWALELLVEQALRSAARTLGPGAAVRRVLECVAAGALLPGGPGLRDPCEREPTDALGPMSAQEREDLTASAQHALRLVAFRQIHRVLGMDPLPRRRPASRKRPRDSNPGPGAGTAGKKARRGVAGDP